MQRKLINLGALACSAFLAVSVATAADASLNSTTSGPWDHAYVFGGYSYAYSFFSGIAGYGGPERDNLVNGSNHLVLGVGFPISGNRWDVELAFSRGFNSSKTVGSLTTTNAINIFMADLQYNLYISNTWNVNLQFGTGLYTATTEQTDAATSTSGLPAEEDSSGLFYDGAVVLGYMLSNNVQARVDVYDSFGFHSRLMDNVVGGLVGIDYFLP